MSRRASIAGWILLALFVATLVGGYQLAERYEDVCWVSESCIERKQQP